METTWTRFLYKIKKIIDFLKFFFNAVLLKYLNFFPNNSRLFSIYFFHFRHIYCIISILKKKTPVIYIRDRCYYLLYFTNTVTHKEIKWCILNNKSVNDRNGIRILRFTDSLTADQGRRYFLLNEPHIFSFISWSWFLLHS